VSTSSVRSVGGSENRRSEEVRARSRASGRWRFDFFSPSGVGSPQKKRETAPTSPPRYCDGRFCGAPYREGSWCRLLYL
jgi:hypothetical protein